MQSSWVLPSGLICRRDHNGRVTVVKPEAIDIGALTGIKTKSASSTNVRRCSSSVSGSSGCRSRGGIVRRPSRLRSVSSALDESSSSHSPHPSGGCTTRLSLDESKARREAGLTKAVALAPDSNCSGAQTG